MILDPPAAESEPSKLESRFRKISREYPSIAQTLYWRAECDERHPDSFQELIRKSKPYELPFLRWECVRKGLGWDVAPLAILTGFEGYYAGSGLSCQELAKRIAQHGLDLFQSIHIPGIHPSVLEKTLLGQDLDRRIIKELNDRFGSLLSRLRSEARSTRPDAFESFQMKLNQDVRGLPPIEYTYRQMTSNTPPFLLVTYFVPSYQHPGPLEMPALSEEEKRGFTVMTNIGRIGFPILRAALPDILRR